MGKFSKEKLVAGSSGSVPVACCAAELWRFVCQRRPVWSLCALTRSADIFHCQYSIEYWQWKISADGPCTAALSGMPSLLLWAGLEPKPSDFAGLVLQLSTEGFVKCLGMSGLCQQIVHT